MAEPTKDNMFSSDIPKSIINDGEKTKSRINSQS